MSTRKPISDPTFDALRDSGVIDAAQLEAVERARAEAPGGTWGEAFSAADLAPGAFAAALSVVDRTDPVRGARGDGKPGDSGERYASLYQLGEGGMGRVDLVDDTILGRRVAMKRSSEGRAAHTARFLREARVTAQLEHPGIVPVYDVGRAPGGDLYYTMRRVSGRTLTEAMRDGGTVRDRMALIGHVIDLGYALGYAHGRGVVHRDVKPDNVMIGRFGETLLVDWGLARVLGEPGDDRAERSPEEPLPAEPSLTGAGAVLGTPRYMSPEQARGEPAEARSDVWSVGVILYEILAGHPLFTGDARTVLAEVARGGPPALRFDSEVPEALRAIARRALSATPADRFADGAGVAQALDEWRSSVLRHSLNTGGLRAVTSAWNVLTGLIACLLVATVAFVGWVAWQVGSPGAVVSWLVVALSAGWFWRYAGGHLAANAQGAALLLGSPDEVLRGRILLYENELEAWVGPAARTANLVILPSTVTVVVVLILVAGVPAWTLAALIGFYAPFLALGYLWRVPKLRRSIAALEGLASASERSRDQRPTSR